MTTTPPTNKQLLPLHVHTVYSVLDGASTIDEYLKWCKENGAQAMGVTDHGWMIGANELYHKAKKAGVTPLPGCEFYLIPDADYNFAQKPYDYYHVTAWAVNETGYRNLLKLGSLSFGEDEILQKYIESRGKKKEKGGQLVHGMRKRVVTRFGAPKPRITFDELLTHHEGLVLGTGCLIGALNKAFLQGEKEGAERNLNRLLEVYKGRLFVEIMPHKVTHDWDRSEKLFKHNECTDFAPDGDVQRSCNNCSIEISQKYKLPLLMTVDSHFVEKKQHSLQTVLLQNGEEGGWHFYNSYHMITTVDAWDHWKATHGDDKEQRLIFAEGVENNHALADMAKDILVKDEFQQPEVKIDKDLGELQTPEPQKLKLQIMRAINAHGRMRWEDPVYTKRLAMEMEVICDNEAHDFSKYFLSLEQWGVWARNHSILSAPGRGSGAGSLLCYLLKITHLDPIRHQLPFERFLSPARIKRKKFPDIDWDLGDRDPLVAWLQETYGDRFAQCSTHGTLKIKSAIKDACRAILGWSSNDDRVNLITKNIEQTPTGVQDIKFLMGYTDQDGNEHEALLDRDTALKNFFDEYPQIFEAVKTLLGIPRSVGRHASAYFISDRPISESSPTCKISGVTCTQYTAAQAEQAGLIKFDLLKVNTLLDISACIRLVQRRLGYKVWKETFTYNGERFEIWQGELGVDQLPMKDGRILDLYDLPEDEEVYKNFDSGETAAVFQMNTPLLTDFCQKVKPRNLNDGSAIVALVRPGPLTAKIEDGKTTMTDAYIERKHGRMSVTYAHPDMEPILKDTYGVAVYQEQLQQMFSDLAGYSLEEADEVREIIGKKKQEQMEKLIPELRRRLAERSWTESQIEGFVNLCIASAKYSFNRSHSASYATVAYQCMFLKHYYKEEWWTAVLQNAKVEDIRDKNYTLEIRDILELPHINGPTTIFDLMEDGKVHSPLRLLDGIGDAACAAIARARISGNFTSFQDFFDRVDRRAVNQGVMHTLILCGMFNKIEPTKSIKDLMFEYHLFKRTLELKCGKDEKGMPKKGEALWNASVELYNKMKEKGETLDVPELYSDAVELEVRKMRSMPIYRLDVYQPFKKLFESHKFLYGPEPWRVTFNDGKSKVNMMRNYSFIEKYDALVKESKGDSTISDYQLGWAGLVQSMEEFPYTDKRTKKKVVALKVYVSNDGDTVECVLWPKQYEQKRTIKESAVVFCIGKMKRSKEPGKWSMSVDRILEL